MLFHLDRAADDGELSDDGIGYFNEHLALFGVLVMGDVLGVLYQMCIRDRR